MGCVTKRWLLYKCAICCWSVEFAMWTKPSICNVKKFQSFASNTTMHNRNLWNERQKSDNKKTLDTLKCCALVGFHHTPRNDQQKHTNDDRGVYENDCRGQCIGRRDKFMIAIWICTRNETYQKRITYFRKLEIRCEMCIGQHIKTNNRRYQQTTWKPYWTPAPLNRKKKKWSSMQKLYVATSFR